MRNISLIDLRGITFLVLISALFSSVPTFSQDTLGTVLDSPSRIRVVVEELTIPFTVTDSKNQFVTDLSKEDFRLFDANHLQEIRGFTRETETPLRIGILVDTSGSISDRLVFEQSAAIEFVQALLRPEKDKAFLTAFNTKAQVIRDFTDDPGSLVEAIRSLQAGGGTALYDAIREACGMLLKEAPLGSVYRPTLVVLSDGEDNQSFHTRAQALEMAQRADVTIFAISTNLRGVRIVSDEGLQALAGLTGGRFFQPVDAAELRTAFQEISTELRSQYTLSYQPLAPRDGNYHRIEIVPQRDGLFVRSRRGYFAVQPR